MSKNRLEAFSDGVIAIIITIMVLELHAPEEPTLQALLPLLPTFLSYVLSFVFVGIYWNNHHHLLQACKEIDGRVLWANLHLLFWLSLIPFVTRWMGGTGFATLPVALYGVVLWVSGFAYYWLSRALIAKHGRDSVLAKAVGKDVKGLIALALYSVAIPATFVNVWVAFGLYVVVALMWFVPDRRIENTIGQVREN